MTKEGLGVINWWGFSPAIDLLGNELVNCSQKKDVNILLVGSGDSRHILSTLSKLYKNDVESINLYVVESNIELYARYMLQLIIGLIPLTKIGLQEKTELFLELYGNSLVRVQSMEFVRQMATTLIRLITDISLCAETLPFLDLTQLKFKERDIMESVFKIWRDTNPKSFDASLCWDLRVRQHLSTRYDAIPNVFDWDCSMTLHDRGAEIINSKEYGHWRHKGVAYQLRDAEYDVSNRTLASGRVLTAGSGDKTVRLGYWGDIVCSPYLGFGIRSTNSDLFKKANNQYMWGASRVAEYNVSALFYELAHNEEYMEASDVPTCATITEVDETDEESVNENLDEHATMNPSHLLHDLIPMPRVKVTFLPVNALSDSLVKKEMYHNLFDLMYFSTSLVGSLDTFTSLPDRLTLTGKVVIEIPTYIVNLNNEQIGHYRSKIDTMCDRLGLQKQPSLSETANIVYAMK